MRISAKQYASSLYEAAQDKKDSQVKDVIKKFTAILVNNNDIAKADRIITEFEKLWNKEKSIVEAGITSARELDKKIIKLLGDYIVKLSRVKKVEATRNIDKSLLGGVVIKYGDKVIDGSLRAMLSRLKKEMVK